MDSKAFAEKAVEVCEDRKADDVLAFDVRKTSILTDYYVICSGNSDAHIRAIMSHLDKTFKELGIVIRNIEGIPISHWIVMDYYDVLIHIFHSETRKHYQIEQLLESSQLIYGNSHEPAD